jgi:bifunctional non-homologous end joining protein LigD
MAAASVLTVGRRKVPVSNLDKVLYPGGRFTKAQVIDYYTRVSKHLLPHLKNRPVTLKRYPDGVSGKSFYEKNAPSFTPDWVKTFPVPRREGGLINYILVNDLPTLVWVANMASLELHPFLHRAPKISTPSYVVFDLDPGEGADILTCAEVALLVRSAFDDLGMKTFAKVSGSKGIQVYVPLNVPVTYAVTQPFAKALAERLAREHPRLIVSQMSKSLRRGKVFIDWSQNAEHKTTVAVYSLRAKHEHPFVSMPMKWQELESALRAEQRESLYIEAEEAIARLSEVGDLFAPVLKLRQRLPKSGDQERMETNVEHAISK